MIMVAMYGQWDIGPARQAQALVTALGSSGYPVAWTLQVDIEIEKPLFLFHSLHIRHALMSGHSISRSPNHTLNAESL